MFIKSKTAVLFFVFILIMGTHVKALKNEQADRLRNSLRSSNNSKIPIDVLYTEEVITTPEEVNKENMKRAERTEEMRRKTNSATATYGSFGIPMPDGSERRLSQTLIRIGEGLKIRNDTKIYANLEKTETNYDVTTINTGFGKDIISYRIEHKLKEIWIHKGVHWPGRQILRFGKINESMLLDIVRFSNLKVDVNKPKKKTFEYRGTNKIDGKDVDEIEFIDLEKGRREYRLSLDSNDWSRCRKIVWYDKESGLVSESIEYKEFLKAQVSNELFPRLVIKRYFNEEGKEAKIETIRVEHVIIGGSISEEIFDLSVPEEYSLFDITVTPPKVIKQTYEKLSEDELQKALDEIRKD